MKNTIQVIPLKQIYDSGSNPRRTMDTEAIKDLAENIRIHGLLNPLLLRPGKKNAYELVAGHRRFAALKQLDLKEVSCTIRKLSDEEALELAVIENLQREDVHPLDEAQAFETILKKISIEDLAKKINKSESYIARRVKLNYLCKEAKKDYSDGHLELAHVTQLCRLDHSIQKKCLEELQENDWYGGREINFYGSPVKLKAIIERDVFMRLNSAPFKKDDAELYLKAGACTLCPKRTGANKMLFNEYIDKEDCCLDKKCYKQKLLNLVVRKGRELQDEGHKFILLKDSYMPDDEKKTMLMIIGKKEFYSEYNATILKKEEKNSIKGLWVNGDKIGHVVNVRDPLSSESSGRSKISGAASELSPKEQIAKTEDRLSRSIEIDRGRLGAKLSNILDSVVYFSDKKLISDQPAITPLEKELFFYSLYEQGGYKFRDVFGNIICPGINVSTYDKNNNIKEKLRSITTDQEAQILRVFIKIHIFDINMQLLEHNLYRTQAFTEICEHYKKDETDKALQELKAIREKREKNAAAKIEALKKEIKPNPKTKTKKS